MKTWFLSLAVAASMAGGAAGAATLDVGAAGFLDPRGDTPIYSVGDVSSSVIVGSLDASDANFDAFLSGPIIGPLDLVVFSALLSGGSTLLAADSDGIEAIIALEDFLTGDPAGFALAQLLPDTSGGLDLSDGGVSSDLTLTVWSLTPTAVIPLPAAAPMLLAGLGALAVATRRRKG